MNLSFEDFMQGLIGLIVFACVGFFIFMSGQWYAQSQIDSWRCELVQGANR
jgi:hypothetical protein